MVHGKAPIGTRPRLVQLAALRRGRRVITKATRPVSSWVRPGRRAAPVILTVLKRCVVLWVKEAMK